MWERVGVLDVLGIEGAHVVGRSMAGAIALILVDHRDRVESLTFVGTTSGDDGLPPMSPGFLGHTADPPRSGGPARGRPVHRGADARLRRQLAALRRARCAGRGRARRRPDREPGRRPDQPLPARHQRAGGGRGRRPHRTGADRARRPGSGVPVAARPRYGPRSRMRNCSSCPTPGTTCPARCMIGSSRRCSGTPAADAARECCAVLLARAPHSRTASAAEDDRPQHHEVDRGGGALGDHPGQADPQRRPSGSTASISAFMPTFSANVVP